MADIRILVVLVAGVLGVGTLSSVLPALGWALWVCAGLTAGLTVAVAGVRRELRIRRRLAAIQPIRAGVPR